ncbi:hypothetical protein H8356DRAFT_1630779 [Neocallimastix lanati (nom. inval.)]|jgi:hypothetical protein|nr:hypothetical protein H8356DRAFT_1630779 [Neocallimastix sp. JGI-2020a]
MIKENNNPLIVFGKHQFEAEEDDEVEFQTGDPILVLEKDEEFNDGWWKGCTVNGEIGIFPANYITTENIFNVNLDGLFDEYINSERRSVPNIIEDKNGLSPFGTFNSSLSINNSEDGIIRRSLSKSAESSNSSNAFENRPSSPNGSVSSMRALSSPRLSASLPNNIRMMSGDLDHMTPESVKSKNSIMGNQIFSNSQPSLIQHFSQQSQQSHQSYQSHQSQSSSVRMNNSQIRKPQDWDVGEVCVWLSSVDCGKIIPAIKENNITGDKLLELNLSKLREYGLHSLSERIELLHEILSLREEYAENNKNLFSSLHTSNASSFTSDYESFSNEQNKLHKLSSNFSISEYIDKSDNDFDDDQTNTKSLSSNGSNRIFTNQEKYHHELPVTPQNYKQPNIPSINNNYGGMVGMKNMDMNMSQNMNQNQNINRNLGMNMNMGMNIGMGNGSGNRNRSLSLQNEAQRNNYAQNIGNSLSRSMSISTADRFGDRTGIDFKNAERKGWLYVRFDDDINWKKRWVVLIDNRLFILKSPDSDEDSSVDLMAPKILLTLELDPTYKVLPDTNSNNQRDHNFLLQDPRIGGIHLAAENQLSVVTWINVLVRACTNTKRKPLPLIPLKNIGRQAREPLLSTQAVSTLTFEKVKSPSYPTIYEDQSMEYNSQISTRKNSINMSINGILSPNLESDYAGSYYKHDESYIADSSPMLKNRINSIISSTFPINPISPITPTQTAAAAANGWYRTNAKSATDYSNYRNLQNVSQEDRLQLQKTTKKLADPVVVTPILNPKKTMSFNPNQIDPDDDFNLNETSGMMSFLSVNEYNSSNKYGKGNMDMIMGNKKHTSISSYSNYGYKNNNMKVSPIEMMERRGIGSFITNNQTKSSKSKKNSALFW